MANGDAPAADARDAVDSGPADVSAEGTPGQPGDGSLGDKNIKYFGRWDFTDRTQYVSYWGGGYLTVSFTGTTLRVKVGSATNLYGRIDGALTKFANVNGVVNLTPKALAPGTHVAVVSGGKDYGYELRFGGLVLDAGATTAAAPMHPALVEFIGDSITAGYTDTMADVSDYAWVAAETLNVEHTQIAYPGIALVNGYGLNGDKTGMDHEYFKLKPLGYPTNPDWDFSVYTPALIVINIGTNDRSTSVPASAFLTSYSGFLAAVRAQFPAAEILVMRCFNGAMADPTLMAVAARTTMGDMKVHYVDTTGWLTDGDYNDGTHPSDAGQMKVAALLAPILTHYLPATR